MTQSYCISTSDEIWTKHASSSGYPSLGVELELKYLPMDTNNATLEVHQGFASLTISSVKGLRLLGLSLGYYHMQSKFVGAVTI